MTSRLMAGRPSPGCSKNPRIDRNRIGIDGHSEGRALAALVAATSNHVAFVIGSAAAGVPTDSAEIFSSLNPVYPRKVRSARVKVSWLRRPPCVGRDRGPTARAEGAPGYAKGSWERPIANRAPIGTPKITTSRLPIWSQSGSSSISSAEPAGSTHVNRMPTVRESAMSQTA